VVLWSLLWNDVLCVKHCLLAHLLFCKLYGKCFVLMSSVLYFVVCVSKYNVQLTKQLTQNCRIFCSSSGITQTFRARKPSLRLVSLISDCATAHFVDNIQTASINTCSFYSHWPHARCYQILSLFPMIHSTPDGFN